MEQKARRDVHNTAGTSNRSSSSSSYNRGPASFYQRKSSMPQPRAVPDLPGRARKKAELNRLDQEIRLLQEELQRLNTLPPASQACREFVHSVESQSQSDPFLPNSQWDPQWDRWFRGPPVPKSTFCCIPSPRI